MLLVSGIAWLVFALIVFQGSYTTVYAVSILFGIVAIMAGVAEFVGLGLWTTGWKWVHGILGVLFLIAGIWALVHPHNAFATLAALMGLFLLVKGIYDIMVSFITKQQFEMWWLQLVLGILEVFLAFWVSGSFRRWLILLVAYVGIIALSRGLTDIFVAFKLRGLDFVEREDVVDDGPRTAARDELVGAREVARGSHRRAEDGELLPPDPVEVGRRIRPGRGAADRDATARRGDVERGPPRRLADVLDHDVGATAAGCLLYRCLHVAGRVIHRRVRPELPRTFELRVARRGDDDLRPQSLRDRERSGRDAPAAAPREHPLALLQARARDEHPIGGFEDERKGGRLLEAQTVGNGVDVGRRHGDQLRVRAVPVLADHVDPAAADLDTRIDDDRLARLEAGYPLAERLHETGAVGAEDARFRNRRQALADPDVEMVKGRGSQADEHLACAGSWIGNLLEDEYLGTAVLVDANRAH